MKRNLLIILFFAFTGIAKAQKTDTTIYRCAPLKWKGILTVGDKDSLSYFDSCPHFPGGEKAWYKFLRTNLKWPNSLYDGKGTEFLDFVVEKDGRLTNIKILRPLTPEFDKEALRVIKLSPRWIPAKLNGKAYRCRFTIPIRFQIEN